MYRRRKPRRHLIILLVAILFVGWSIIFFGRQLAADDIPADPAASLPPQENLVTIYVDEIEDTQYLKLLNREHSMRWETSRAHMVPAYPTVPVGTAANITLHQTALQAVHRLFAAAREAGIDNLFVSSGFRDYARQRQLYESILDASLVLPPGHSEHHTGLAADILARGIDQFQMSASKEGRWLADNAWRFGFVLRYPDDKQHITGVAYEPWHFRYVGQPHANHISGNNLTLEEYIWFLQDTGGYTITVNGRNYYILYARPQNGKIFVPEGLSFRISSDNTGGYIITAWR